MGMPMGSENDDLKKIEDVDKRLYRRAPDERSGVRFDALRPRRFPTPKDWGPLEKHKKTIMKTAEHPSLFKKFFLYSVGFAIVAFIIGVIIFFAGGNTVSNTNIDINVLGNSFTGGGEELPLQVEVVNKNSTPLELADLFVEYEKGGDSQGGSAHVRDLNSLGTIGSGKTLTKNIFVTLFGEEGSQKTIDFTLQYRIKGSNAIFVKRGNFTVTIKSAPIALSVDSPQTISPNQELSFVVKTQSNSKDVLKGLLVHIDYPSGFKFTKAEPLASALDNTWDIGDLAPGATREIRITGMVYGQDGEDRAFHIYVGASSQADHRTIGVTYNSMLQKISLVKPFLAARLLVNGSTETVVPVPSSSTVRASVNWSNNLPTQITNAEVIVSLSGNAINMGSIASLNGFYDSSRNVVVWNKTTNPELGSIEPGDSGTLDLTFDTLPLWTAGKQPIANPSIKLSVSIKGNERDTGGGLSTITNFEEKTAVVSSDFGFGAGAFYTSGPFSNTGPIPPKANQPTTYTITWSVTNSANTLTDGVATATLPTYVDWVGTASPQSESIEYDSTTRSIKWRIGQVPVGAGLSAPSKSVSFQVRLLPSTSQVGSTPKLILDMATSARDTFTKQLLSASRSGLSTRLDNDPGFPAGGEIVTN